MILAADEQEVVEALAKTGYWTAFRDLNTSKTEAAIAFIAGGLMAESLVLINADCTMARLTDDWLHKLILKHLATFSDNYWVTAHEVADELNFGVDEVCSALNELVNANVIDTDGHSYYKDKR